MSDPVNNPAHYKSHPSGVECITITEHMGFCLGNAIKYIWRADLKADAIGDLKKARWYLDREIARREAAGQSYDHLKTAKRAAAPASKATPQARPGAAPDGAPDAPDGAEDK